MRQREGRPRNPDTWDLLRVDLNDPARALALQPTAFFDRGYTGHEHMAGFGLINMNGRVYDPYLQRFLSPDPFVQAPTNAQNYNRYSYVLNNPLMYTDPSGYTTEPIHFGGNVGWMPSFMGRTLERLGFGVFTPRNCGGGGRFTFSFYVTGGQSSGGTAFEGGASFSSGNFISQGGATFQGPNGAGASTGGNVKQVHPINDNGTNSDLLYIIGIASQTGGFTAEGVEGILKVFQLSNQGVRAAALELNISTQAIDEIVRKTNGFTNLSKWVGRGFLAAGVVVNVIEGVDAYNQGYIPGVTKAGLDMVVGLGTAFIGGPIGVILYGNYLIIINNPIFPSGPEPLPDFPRDKTFVAPKY